MSSGLMGLGDEQPTWGQRVKGAEEGAGNGVIGGRGWGGSEPGLGEGRCHGQGGAAWRSGVSGQEGGRQRMPALGSRLRVSPGRGRPDPRRGGRERGGGSFSAKGGERIRTKGRC